MNIDAIIIGCIVGLSGLYALFNIFGVVGLSSGIAVIVIYGILLKLNPEKPKEKTVFQNIRIKLPVIMILAGIIWVVAGKFNFPIWWQIEFVAFAFVGFCFFTLLDWKTLKEEKTTFTWVRRLLTTYAFGSLVFITVSAQLPQFDPE
ncbi:MAG: cytochrome C, partial [Nitrospina sp.]|nr:cytochrome C [Nitrospina sp.]